MVQLHHVVLLLLVLPPVIGCDGNRQPERTEAEASTRKIVLTDAGDQKILAIKAVREVTGLGLKDAKGIVDSPPSVVMSRVSVEKAEVIASKLRKTGMTIDMRNESLLSATEVHAQEGFRAGVGLYDSAHLEWLENKNRLGKLCTDSSTLADCRSEHLAPSVSEYPLHIEPDSSSRRIGDLIVEAVPGEGLSSHFRVAGSQQITPFTPDLFLQDWGYGPYFHQTVSARSGNWFKLPRGPWEDEVWVHRESESEHSSVILVQPEDIVEMSGTSWYVIAAEPDALLVRAEQPADFWCEEGDPPSVTPSESTSFSREKLRDSDGHLAFRLKYLKGC